MHICIVANLVLLRQAKKMVVLKWIHLHVFFHALKLVENALEENVKLLLTGDR